MSRNPGIAAAVAVLWASSPAWPRSEVTLHNFTDRDLVVAHAQGPGEVAMAVASHCSMADHSLCSVEPRPFGQRVCDGICFPVEGRPTYEYWLKRGDSTTFTFEAPGPDVKGEALLQGEDGKAPMAVLGLLVYTLPFNPKR